MQLEKSVCVLVQPNDLVDYFSQDLIAAALSKLRIKIYLCVSENSETSHIFCYTTSVHTLPPVVAQICHTAVLRW